MSPVRAESRQLLESPRRKLRSVCKTPYRVLDAPELADDFYLNLVDWSSTNVLGVGLGSAVYLWAAHTAAVSKLCDLSTSNDTISSVAWAQKVRDRSPPLYAVPDSCFNFRDQHWQLAHSPVASIFSTPTPSSRCGLTTRLTTNGSAPSRGTGPF